MGTLMAESLRFEVVPIWEPRFLYSSHSGVACHPLSRCEASFSSASSGSIRVRDFFAGMALLRSTPGIVRPSQSEV